MRSIHVWLGLTLLMGGCTAEPVLIPDRGAIVASGDPNVAVATEAGVKVAIHGDAWRDEPRDLTEVMTPLRVSIQNRSAKRLRLAYQDVSLLGASGFRYPALAPMTGEAQVSEAVPNAGGPSPRLQVVPVVATRRSHPDARFQHDRFLVARHYYPLYPGFQAWSLAFPYDPFYYQRYQDMWPVALPTRDMLAQALPEGVLEDGGRVDGFIYFQNVSREQSVRFELKLVDADTGEDLGLISVPFTVARR